MQRSPHPTWIEIDLDQFRKNLSLIRSCIGDSLLCLPVKANAYGHGLAGIGKAAQEAGVDYLAVSCLQEGVNLRREGISLPILVLGAIHEDQIDDLIEFNLEFSISSEFKAKLVAQKGSRKCRVHLEVETGMQRTGVRSETALRLIEFLRKSPCFDVVGVYSHLATADVPNDLFALKQISLFQSLVAKPPFKGLIAHIANSGGIAHYPQSRFGMVRPGLMAYGYPGPFFPFPLSGLAPCFSLKSKVSYVKTVSRGSGIGYGHTYTTKTDTRVVTIPIGYGDGYRRTLSNKGSVLIRGKKFPIAGMICMDQLMVDVGQSEIYVGDEVVLIGRQQGEEITLNEISEICDTIPYEILSLLNERIPRIYTCSGSSAPKANR